MEIPQGKTTVAEASCSYDLPPSEIETWIDEAKRGMENALRANPLDIREQYEKQITLLEEAYGEAMLELRARRNCSPCWRGEHLQGKVVIDEAAGSSPLARGTRAGPGRPAG